MKRKHLLIVLTDKSKCDCSMHKNPKLLNRVTKEDIDELFKYIEEIDYITLGGGEPWFEPELCFYIKEKGKPINLNISEEPDDPDFIEKLKPDLLTIFNYPFHNNIISNYLSVNTLNYVNRESKICSCHGLCYFDSKITPYCHKLKNKPNCLSSDRIEDMPILLKEIKEKGKLCTCI
jgi:hypothetical protein